MDFWISEWISGFQIGFLDFRVDFWISLDFWISDWISADSVRDFFRGGPLGDSKSPYVSSPIPLVSVVNSSTHSAPPPFWLATVFVLVSQARLSLVRVWPARLYLFSYFIYIILGKANRELGSSNKATLRWGVPSL